MNEHAKNALKTLVIVAAIFGIVRFSAQDRGLGTKPSRAVSVNSEFGDFSLGERTQTSGCTVVEERLPDPECTPGAVFSSATAEDVCVPGYATRVRDVPQSVKNEVYEEYGIETRLPGEYEVDHLINLSIGGSNDIANLWPEAAGPKPGFHEKDRYENYLHDQVCKGAIPLREAQFRMASDWHANWQRDMNQSQ